MWLNIFIFSFIATVLSAKAHNNKADNDWDILIFTQQWPVTVCWELQKHHHTAECHMPPKRDSWSIHGIWPTKLGTIGPGFCNRTWLFDPEQVRPIENRLMQYWTDIDAASQHYSFWAHEWNKHGTCAAMLESLSSEFKYFSKGLEWLGKFAMGDILAGGDISPSNTFGYEVLDIHKAIKAKLGINPAIECRKENGVSVIDEIRICFDKKLNLCDCNGIKKHKMIGDQPVITNCDPSQRVLYPHYAQESSYVEFFKLVAFLKWLTL